MIHKKYIDEFSKEPLDIEFLCPETEEENEKMKNEIDKLILLNYFINGGKLNEK